MTFCENSAKAYIIIDGVDQVVSINPPVSISYEEIEPIAYSIKWDRGTHILNNPENYSYKILEYSHRWRIRARENNYNWTVNTPYLATPSRPSYIKLENNNLTCNLGQTIYFASQNTYHKDIYDGNSKFLVRKSVPLNFLTNFTFVSIENIANDSFLKLIITDNGIDYIYDINDENSINTIFNDEQCKVSVSDLSGVIFEKQYDDSCPIPYIINCDTRQCPQETCCEIICNNFTCCYSGQGILIDQFSNYS